MRMLILFAIYSLFMSDAICADNKAAVAFSRANADKYKNEISEVKGLAWGSKITVTGTITKDRFSTYDDTYDSEKSEMVLGRHWFLLPLTFFESCKATGSSFVGQNAFGATTVVRPQTCESFREIGDGLVELGGKSIRMSPSQFRTIMKKGVRVEIDLTVGNPEKKPVVSFEESVENATVNKPTQTHWKLWTLYGHETALRWFLPGEKEPVEVWSRSNGVR